MSVQFFAKEVSAAAAMVACAFWSLLGVAIPAAGQVETVVEYGYSDVWSCGPDTSTGQILCLYYDSYFVTSSPDEIAVLDAGGLGSPYCCHWFRTYETFNVWSGPESGALPTCRFFNPTFFDHFYTPYAAECAAIQARIGIGYTRGSPSICKSRTKAAIARSAQRSSIVCTTTAWAAGPFTD